MRVALKRRFVALGLALGGLPLLPGVAHAHQAQITSSPGVTITKSASAGTINPGDSFTYAIVVSNTGNAGPEDVVVTDTVPVGLEIGNVAGPNCSVDAQTVTCNVGTLNTGATVTVAIDVTTTAGACPSVTNTAHVTSSGGSTDSNSITVRVNCAPGVQIVLNSDAPSPGIDAGDSFTYATTVTNDGNATAERVVVTDMIPDGLEIDGVSGPNCSVSRQAVTCNIGDVVAGAFVTIAIRVTTNDRACPAVENVVHVDWSFGEETSTKDGNILTTDIDCAGEETVTPTPPPDDDETVTLPRGLAFTGPHEGPGRLGLLSIALLVLGTGLMLAGYRSRARHDDG